MYTYKLTLLSPLFYRSRQDSGAAGATVTDTWIGDLAICFAINKALGITHIPFKYTSNKPEYEDILDIPLITSIAIPNEEPKRTRLYDVATNFMSEGYPNMPAIENSARTSMKNWLKRQGIEPGTEYTFVMAVRDNYVPPEKFTIRLGNMQETLAVCEKQPGNNKSLTANLFTLKHVFGHESVKGLEYEMLERPAQQYVLAHGVDATKWLSLVSPYM